MELSKREIEVVHLVSSELTLDEIALKLSLSRNTIKSHCKNIREKLGVKNIAGIVRMAFQKGYLQVSQES